MASVATEATYESLADPVLINAVQNAVLETMAMGDITVRCVSISSVPSRDPGHITGLIGVHGEVTGFITVNVTELVAIEAVSGLLLESCDTIDHQVIDGVGELTNMIAGVIRKGLSGTVWAFSHVTGPSVIIGQNYDIVFSQGFRYLSLTFESTNCKSLMVRDRLIRASVSLFRR